MRAEPLPTGRSLLVTGVPLVRMHFNVNFSLVKLYTMWIILAWNTLITLH